MGRNGKERVDRERSERVMERWSGEESKNGKRIEKQWIELDR